MPIKYGHDIKVQHATMWGNTTAMQNNSSPFIYDIKSSCGNEIAIKSNKLCIISFLFQNEHTDEYSLWLYLLPYHQRLIFISNVFYHLICQKRIKIH